MLNRSISKDPLSIMLSKVRLNVQISVNAQFCGGWLLGSKAAEKSFHLISHGGCLLEIEGEAPQNLSAGDLVIFMRDVQHSLSATQCVDEHALKAGYSDGIIAKSTGILCGSFAYENTKMNGIMDALPAILVIKNDEQSKRWVNPLVQLIQLENTEPGLGSDLLLKQLTETLIVHAIRTHIKAGSFEVGILKLLADPKLNKALQVIQNEPDVHWTVEHLAKQCAMSRTAFATHFKQVSGWSPIEYVTWWRMQSAWSRLVEGESVSQVAERVGYRSDAAFSRAFKKAFAVGPGEVRNQV